MRLTVERVDTTIEADVLSGRSPPPLTATSVLRLDADDELERTRVSADAVFERLGFALADRAQAAVYYQDSETIQRSICPNCNVVTVTIQSISIRFEPPAFDQLARMIGQARAAPLESTS